MSALFTDRMGRIGIRSAQILFAIALAGVIVFALVQVKLIVIPILIAIILAAAAAPVVAWLRRHHVPAVVATLITLVGGGIVIGGIVTLIVFSVSSQWDELSTSASEGLNRLQDSLNNLSSLPISEEQLQKAKDEAVSLLTSSQLGTGVVAGVSAATQVITGIVLGLVILFFFLKDGAYIWSFLTRPFSGAGLARGRRIGDAAMKTLGGYVRGTAIIAVVDSVAIGIGLAIVQVPLALPLATLVFLGAFIPLIGATIAGVLAVLIALVTNGPVTALIVVAIVIAVNQLEGNLLQPVVMGQSLKLHPLMILLALTVGTILGGIIGAVIAVPIAAVGWAIIKVWDVDGEPGADNPSGSEDESDSPDDPESHHQAEHGENLEG